MDSGTSRPNIMLALPLNHKACLDASKSHLQHARCCGKAPCLVEHTCPQEVGPSAFGNAQPLEKVRQSSTASRKRLVLSISRKMSEGLGRSLPSGQMWPKATGNGRNQRKLRTNSNLNEPGVILSTCRASTKQGKTAWISYSPKLN